MNENHDEKGRFAASDASKDAWFDFDSASAIKDYQRGADIANFLTTGGEGLSSSEISDIKSHAAELQRAAETNSTGERVLYRGQTAESMAAVQQEFPIGKTVTTNSLTATSPDHKVASIYSDVDNYRGGEGVRVMLQYENAKGIGGVKLTDKESLIPKGASYKVTRIFERDNHIVVNLYASKSLRKADKPRKVVITVDLSTVGGIIKDDLTDLFAEGGSALMAAVAEAPFGIFDQINEAALKYAKERSAALVTEIEDTTRDRLQDLVSSALEDGRDPSQLGDDIWSSSMDFSEDRAYTIAITELADAQGQGALETAKDTGVDMEKKWIRGDDTPCDICDPNADEGWIDIDQEFPSGDDTVSGHPHCLCDVVFRVKEASDDEA